MRRIGVLSGLGENDPKWVARHTVGNAVERAYRRTDLFEKRRKLMADWARYCATKLAAAGNNVVSLRGAVQ
jgi:hypothetical protein